MRGSIWRVYFLLFLLVLLSFTYSQSLEKGTQIGGLEDRLVFNGLQDRSASMGWNTFLGSMWDDRGIGVAVDGSGYIYVAGESNLTWGAPINPHNGMNQFDVFVAKLNPSGALEWHAYLGGAGNEYCRDMAVDREGNVYVVGECFASWGNPINPYNHSCEAFVAKLNSSGGREWNTFLGGYGCDQGNGIAVDSSGFVYVSGGSALSWGTPVNPFAIGTDTWDAFAAKLNPSGGLEWNTFMGSVGEDNSNDIAVDGSGNAYIVGESDANWGTPVNPYAGTDRPDAFVAKLNSAGERQWNTFMGAADEYDEGFGIVADGIGNAYVVGTSSVSWGSPVNPHAGGTYSIDAFAAMLNTSGGLVWNTFMGSTYDDMGYSIDIDANGDLYVCGYSGATWGSPINPFAGTPGIPNPPDAFAAKLNSAGYRQWNTFIGGTEGEMGFGIAVDAAENVYVTGECGSTWGTPIRAYAGQLDAFVQKIAPDGIAIAVTSPNGGENWMVGSSHNITWNWAGTVGNVKIEYSTDNGSGWNSVITSTENDGSHPWTVPNDVSSQCLVKVSELDGLPTDTSDATFSIVSGTIPTITVTSPNGGESWDVGTSHDITWTQSGLTGDVTIDLHKGGTFHSNIGTEAAAAESFTWNISLGLPEGNDYKVRLHQGSTEDYSDDNFTIAGVGVEKDDILGTWPSGVWYRNSELGHWVKITTPASLVAAGDIDGDGTDDVIGVWSSGLWIKYSTSGGWAKLAVSLPTDIASGDMNGDGRDDVVATWGSGVWYRNSVSGSWVKLTSAADMVTAGDIDGDGTDDLIGRWSSGLWVRYGSSGSWEKVCTPLPGHIASGDMNGDGRDDVLGTWTSGVFYKDSVSGSWYKMSLSSASLVAAGDIDGDGKYDLIGVWGSGLWVKYSASGIWERITPNSPTDLDAGLYRTGAWDR